MGLFKRKEKKFIAEISKKNKLYHNDIEKEIQYLMDDLKDNFRQNKLNIEEFKSFIASVKTKLSEEELLKLDVYSDQAVKMKSCAKKGIEALNHLYREQQKLSKEVLRDYEEYLT
ncbi:hypothetical protein [Flavobacterium pedocola]